MRKKINDGEKKVILAVTINPTLINIVNKHHNNKSKYIEWLIYQDLIKNNQIEKDIMI